MNLPTKDQVNAASRHLLSALGGAVVMFGIGSKVDMGTVTTIVNTFGSLINDVVLLIGVLAPVYAGWRAQQSAQPASQAASLEKQGAIVVTTPEIAAATPNSPNVLSTTEVKVVSK